MNKKFLTFNRYMIQIKFFFYCLTNFKDLIQLINFIAFKFICLFRIFLFKIEVEPDNKKNLIYFNKYFFLNFKFDRRFTYFYTIQNKFEQIKLIFRFLKKKNENSFYEKSLVELGCGFGMNLFFLQNLKFKEIDGFDINEDYINFGKKFYKNKFNLYLKDVTNKNFQNKKKVYDYLICMNFLGFVDHHKQSFFINELKKISKKIIFIENSFNRNTNKKKFFYDTLMKEGISEFKEQIIYEDKITSLFYYNFKI